MNRRHAHRRTVARIHRMGFRGALSACRLHALWFLTVLLVVPCALPARAGGPVPPVWQQYTVPFLDTFLPDGTDQASPPTNGNDAAATTSARARSILEYIACGHENKFLGLAMNISGTDTYDELMEMAMAKLAWLKAGFGDCQGIFNVVQVKGDLSDFLGTIKTLDDFASQHQAAFNDDCAKDPKSCACAKDQNPASFTLPANLPPSLFLRIKALVPKECLRVQINWVLSRIQKGDVQPGTNGLPCNVEYGVNLVTGHATTKGD